MQKNNKRNRKEVRRVRRSFMEGKENINDELTEDENGFDDFSSEETTEPEEEIYQEAKRTYAEKRALTIQDKLKNLSDRIKKEPPKTILGMKLAIVRLNRLQNMVDRMILKNNTKVLAQQKTYNAYDTYSKKQYGIMDKISDLEFERENILRQLRNLEHLDPSNDNSIFTENKKKITKNMPKGYKQKEPVETTRKPSTKVSIAIQQLEEQLAGLEKEIENNNRQLMENDKEYSMRIAEIENDSKKDLAIIQPNIFKRISKFFKDKINKFNQWRKQRKEKATEELHQRVEATEGSSKREILLSKVDSGMSLEKQNRIAQDLKKELEERAGEQQENVEERTGNDN